MTKIDDLISPEYLAEQKRLHADPRGYGQKGKKWANMVAGLAAIHGCESILDYGCGANTLAPALRDRGFDPQSYDPALAAFARLPAPADLVVCTDVLEHIEHEKLDAVLDHLRALTLKAAFVVIATVPTAKTLSDGRQAHILLHDRFEWMGILAGRFDFDDGDLYADAHFKPDKQLVLAMVPKGNEK